MEFRNKVSAYIRDSLKLEGKARAVPTIMATKHVMDNCKDMDLPEIKKYIDEHRPMLMKKIEGYVKSA